MTRTWSGVIAHVDTPTAHDDRILGAADAGNPPHLDLPLPLVVQDSQNPWRDPIGTVDVVWIDGQDIRGCGTVDLAGRPFDARQALLDGEHVRVAVTVKAPIRTGPGWDREALLGWQIAFVVLGDEHSSWPDATIALDPA